MSEFQIQIQNLEEKVRSLLQTLVSAKNKIESEMSVEKELVKKVIETQEFQEVAKFVYENLRYTWKRWAEWDGEKVYEELRFADPYDVEDVAKELDVDINDIFGFNVIRNVDGKYMPTIWIDEGWSNEYGTHYYYNIIEKPVETIDELVLWLAAVTRAIEGYEEARNKIREKAKEILTKLAQAI